MRVAASTTVLKKSEIKAIHNTMCRILSDVGVRVEHEGFLDRLAAAGGTVDKGAYTVRFSRHYVEDFIDNTNKVDWKKVVPSVSAGAGVYAGWYLDPETDQFTDWTEEKLADYARLAFHLENVECVSLLGSPLKGLDRRLNPLYHRLFCWKYGLAQGGGSIWDSSLCPFIQEMCEYMAGTANRPVKDYFRGMVFLTSTLTLPRSEAEQFMYFAEQGWQVSLCNMTSAGGTAPVTLAGALALHLAQVMFANIADRIFYGGKDHGLYSGIAPYDMRTLMYAYGRPEIPIMGLMAADVARHYGIACGASGGSTDAKRPGAEAGFQKMQGALPALMGCGHAGINAGVLSMDEVGSPIQMILDNEYAFALKRFAAGCEVNTETLAFDVVQEVGIGNLFIDHPHTVSHFREELWRPDLWTHEMYEAWQAHGARTDTDRALERYREIRKKPQPTACKHKAVVCGLTAGQEAHLQEIIKRAGEAL